MPLGPAQHLAFLSSSSLARSTVATDRPTYERRPLFSPLPKTNDVAEWEGKPLARGRGSEGRLTKDRADMRMVIAAAAAATAANARCPLAPCSQS